MNGGRYEELCKLMDSISPNQRYRWCSNEVCGCIGAANCSGGLPRHGFTHDDWIYWVNNNPKEEVEFVEWDQTSYIDHS